MAETTPRHALEGGGGTPPPLNACVGPAPGACLGPVPGARAECWSSLDLVPDQWRPPMRDEEEILGTWTVKFRQWTWEYKFADNKTVRWRDPSNNESGSGRWYQVGSLINISWTDSTTKESWYCPINPDTHSGWIDASYGVGTFEANRTKSGFDYTVPRANQSLFQKLHAAFSRTGRLYRNFGWPGIGLRRRSM